MKAWLLLWIGILASGFGTLTGWIILKPDGQYVIHAFIVIGIISFNLILLNFFYFKRIKTENKEKPLVVNFIYFKQEQKNDPNI